METEDIESIVEATQTNEYECPDPSNNQGAGGPNPLCEGAPAGEVRTGVALARRYSEGFVHSVESYGEMIQEYIDASDAGAEDDLGSGAMRLIAVSCADASESPSECSKSVAIFSGIVSGFEGGTRRELLLFWLPTEDIETSTPIEMVWTGSIPDPDVEILRVGGALPDLGNVFPLPD